MADGGDNRAAAATGTEKWVCIGVILMAGIMLIEALFLRTTPGLLEWLIPLAGVLVAAARLKGWVRFSGGYEP